MEIKQYMKLKLDELSLTTFSCIAAQSLSQQGSIYLVLYLQSVVLW